MSDWSQGDALTSKEHGPDAQLAAAKAVAGRVLAGDPVCRCKHKHGRNLCNRCGCAHWRPGVAEVEQTRTLLRALGLMPYEAAAGRDPITRKVQL